MGAILVCDEQDKIGIFTERDLLDKIDYKNLDKFMASFIRDIMSKNIITVDHKESYSNALNLMIKNNIRHLPVLKEGRVIGVLSLRDMMHHYEENLGWALKIQQEEFQKKLEQIQKSEELFRNIFDNSAVAIMFVDNDGRITFWNPYTTKLLGMTDENLKFKPIKEFYPAEEWQKIRSQNIEELGVKHPWETKLINNKGELIDVYLSFTVVKDQGGDMAGSIAVMRNIRKETQKVTKFDGTMKALEDLKFCFDEHADVVITDKDGVVIYANEKFCRESQYSVQEMIGKDLSIVNSGYHPKEFMHNMWETIKNGKTWKGEFKNKAKDGSFFWLESTIVPFVNEQGEIYQYVSINTNISERKEEEEKIKLANRDLAANVKVLKEIAMDKDRAFNKLRENQQLIIQLEKMATLGTLAAGFAHEVKNPLAIVMQGIERIEKFCVQVKDEANLQYVNMIKSAATRANKVITSLLAYSRASNMEMNPVNIYETIDFAVDLVKNNLRLNAINIRKDYVKNNDYVILGDQIMLQQVFFDLFANAIDAMPEGGTIEITVVVYPSQENNQREKFVIKLKDTGQGITEEHMSKIFDPFFTTKDEGKGTGLGLSTVYTIIERHYGTITVASKEGLGTTFTITLPAIQATQIQRRREYVGQEENRYDR